jgi:Flp pilus assembly protein TadB
MLAGFLNFFFTFFAALAAVKEISAQGLALMIIPLAVAGGFAISRFFLKSYYQKQKTPLAKLINILSKKDQVFWDFPKFNQN